MADGDWLRALWEGGGVGPRIARAALTPAELLFEVVIGARNSMYSSGMLRARSTVIPALSVGNLTVGGTGKTPLAAYIAGRLRADGAKPAIVLRGYGNDEPLVHHAVNPDIPVVVSSDRVAGSLQARELGCDVVVLDDAFQHRRATRVADIVLLSADNWQERGRHLLPAGPWRERLSAARRASLAIVTRKAASPERAASVVDALVRAAGVRTAVVHLRPGDLRDTRANVTAAIDDVRGQSVLAISAIGDPSAFEAQLISTGAAVESVRFRDHHLFTAAEAISLAARASRFDRAVCTLKDAVKLGPLWPGPSPLWYVSQRVDVERGADAVDEVLTITLLARSASTHSRRPGSPRPLD